MDLTDKVSGSGKQITKDPIICRVYSSSVPDLTLIDLPGVTRNPVGDQPKNIEQITKDLVTEYCSNIDTIILCVIPANIDLANSDALKLASQIDPNGQRTLGVLTKIDLMDEGTDCSKVLLNEEIKLLHGYIGVKGRSQGDIQRNVPMVEALKKELDFFGKHPVYSSLPTNLLGTLSLIDKLSTLLYQQIQKSLPRIRNEIQIKIKAVKKSLSSMGEPLPDLDDGKLELVFNLVRQFKDKFDQILNGKYYMGKQEKNSEQDTLTFLMNEQFHLLYQEFVGKDFRISSQYKDSEIVRSIEVYQGENIPGFQSFDAFLNLILPKLELVGPPVFQLLDECKLLLEERGLQLIDEIFKNYAQLNMKMKEIYQKILLLKKNFTLNVLKNLIKGEETYLFTNDALIMRPQPIPNKNLTFQELRILELRQKMDNYFFIVIRNMRETVPKIIGKFLVLDLNNNIQVEILNELNKVNYCLSSLNENKKSASEREKLRFEYQSLSKAENLLVNDFGMGLTVLPELSDVSKQAQDFINKEGEVVDDEMSKNIDKMNENFLSFNQKIVEQEKIRILKELGLSPELLNKNNPPPQNSLPQKNVVVNHKDPQAPVHPTPNITTHKQQLTQRPSIKKEMNKSINEGVSPQNFSSNISQDKQNYGKKLSRMEMKEQIQQSQSKLQDLETSNNLGRGQFSTQLNSGQGIRSS